MALKIIKGSGTIVWGTGGSLAAPAGGIVDSLQLTPKTGEPSEIEAGDGIAAVEVILRDGFNGKAAVLYDQAKTWPIEGANANVAIPFNGANANAVPFGESNQATVANGIVTYVCLVASVSPAYKKKGEAMVDINLTYRPNVAV